MATTGTPPEEIWITMNCIREAIDRGSGTYWLTDDPEGNSVKYTRVKLTGPARKAALDCDGALAVKQLADSAADTCKLCGWNKAKQVCERCLVANNGKAFELISEYADQNNMGRLREAIASALTEEREAERERCATIAENIDPPPPWPSEDVAWRSRRRDVAQEIAAAIRQLDQPEKPNTDQGK